MPSFVKKLVRSEEFQQGKICNNSKGHCEWMGGYVKTCIRHFSEVDFFVSLFFEGFVDPRRCRISIITESCVDSCEI